MSTTTTAPPQPLRIGVLYEDTQMTDLAGLDLLGAKVHMDQRDQGLESIASFYENFRDAKVSMNVKDATKYVCVQIVRERKIMEFNPKILALVLQRLVEEKDAYRRVGLYEFEATGCEFGWQKKKLVLY